MICKRNGTAPADEEVPIGSLLGASLKEVGNVCGQHQTNLEDTWTPVNLVVFFFLVAVPTKSLAHRNELDA